MSLKIINLIKDGSIDKEHILLQATENINISSYALVDRTFNKKMEIFQIFTGIFIVFLQKISKKGNMCP